MPICRTGLPRHRKQRLQGSFTIINAFAFTVVMEYMFSIGKTVFVRLLLAFALPNAIVTVILTSLHCYRGTPNVLATVSPSLIIVAVLSLIYVLIVGTRKMRQGQSGEAVPQESVMRRV